MTGTFTKEASVTKYAVLYIYETRSISIKPIKNGKFSFTGKLSTNNGLTYANGLIILTNKPDYNSTDLKKGLVDTNSISCIVESNFNVVIKKHYARSEVSGKYNRVLMCFKAVTWKYQDIRNGQFKEIESIKKSLTNEASVQIREEKENAIKELLSSQTFVYNIEKIKAQLQVVNENINSTIAFANLHVLAKMRESPMQEVKKTFQRFDPSFKNSNKGKLIAQIINDKIEAEKGYLAIGDHAPIFKLHNTSQQLIDLNRYKGKYVLIDFWASWCNPCRNEMPMLKEIAAENKGLTVMSISLDKNKQKWMNAIKEDQISSFTNLIDTLGFDSNMVKQYSIRSIPQNYLIDKTGKIVAKNIYGKELKDTIAQLLK